MAFPFLPIALSLLAAKDVIGGFAQARAARSEKYALKAQAQAAETDEAARGADRMRRLRQVLAANTASAGELGIDPGSASFLAVQEDSAREAYRGSALDSAFSRAQSSSLRSRANAISPTSSIIGGFLGGGSRLLPLLQKKPAGTTTKNDLSDRGLR